MPYPMEQSASSHLPLQVGSIYFIYELEEDNQFKCDKRTGRVLDVSSGSVLVRWDSFEDVDWEGNKEVRRAFNQRIAPDTQVRLLENE